jgi:hypothetical protein
LHRFNLGTLGQSEALAWAALVGCEEHATLRVLMRAPRSAPGQRIGGLDTPSPYQIGASAGRSQHSRKQTDPARGSTARSTAPGCNGVHSGRSNRDSLWIFIVSPSLIRQSPAAPQVDRARQLPAE